MKNNDLQQLKDRLDEIREVRTLFQKCLGEPREPLDSVGPNHLSPEREQLVWSALKEAVSNGFTLRVQKSDDYWYVDVSHLLSHGESFRTSADKSSLDATWLYLVSNAEQKLKFLEAETQFRIQGIEEANAHREHQVQL